MNIKLNGNERFTVEHNGQTTDILTQVDTITDISVDESLDSGGDNRITISTQKGLSKTFTIKNGNDGADGVSLGEIALVQTTGDSEESVMSQSAITRELAISNESRPITYFSGRLANFVLADHPEFDFRTADGVSVAFAVSAFVSNRVPFLAITPTNTANNGFGAEHFGFWVNWGNFVMGKVTSYGTAMTGGYNPSSNDGKFKHCVITYDFNTGEAKVYYNGVLYATRTTDGYNRQTVVQDFFDTCKYMYISTPTANRTQKYSGVAVFGHALTDDDVALLYNNGCENIKDMSLPSPFKANYLHPLNFNNFGLYIQEGSKTNEQNGSYSLTPNSSSNRIAFGFTGISDVTGMLIYEWDFEVVSGSCKKESYQDMIIYRNGSRYAEFIVYDTNGNDVTNETISVGNYHVVGKPDNSVENSINASSWNLVYFFGICTSDFVMNIKPNLKITERGAALEFSLSTYKGFYWEQTNGIKLTTSPSSYYGTQNLIVGRDSFISNTVIYSSSTLPQFNGQIAVDTVNGKVYIGYLTGTGGTWKQVSNA